MPPQPAYGFAALTGVLAGSVIESEKSVERARATGVISEGALKDGYKIFRWPVGVITAYLGMYKAGYFLGSLDRN